MLKEFQDKKERIKNKIIMFGVFCPEFEGFEFEKTMVEKIRSPEYRTVDPENMGYFKYPNY